MKVVDQLKNKKLSVTIDAGHGGDDDGATFSDIKEKDRNLIMAIAVGIELKERGVDVHFTRTLDEYLSIQERINKSESAGTDMLVSFHTYGKGNTGMGVIIGDNSKIGSVIQTSEGGILRLPRPEYEEELAAVLIKEFQKNWGLKNEEREIIIEGRDTKLKNLGLFAQQRIQKPTFIIELGSIKHKDNDYINNNFNDIVNMATDGIYNALLQNQKYIDKQVEW